LGSDKPPAVRLAGVYAMAGLADDWEENRQTCVDVLCAYLRMPYEPDPGETAHLKEGAAVSCRSFNFDFNGVIFDGGDFRGAEFTSGLTVFDGAEFTGGTVSFRRAEFSGGQVRFGGAKFSGGQVSFTEAEISGTSSASPTPSSPALLLISLTPRSSTRQSASAPVCSLAVRFASTARNSTAGRSASAAPYSPAEKSVSTGLRSPAARSSSWRPGSPAARLASAALAIGHSHPHSPGRPRHLQA